MKASTGDRLLDVAIGFFCGWTLTCHAVVFAGGSLQQLLMLTAVAALAALGWAIERRWRRRQAAKPAGRAEPVAADSAKPCEDSSQDAPGDAWLARGAVWAIAAGLVAFELAGAAGRTDAGGTADASQPLFWLGAIALLLVLAAREWRGADATAPSARAEPWPGATLVLAGVCGVAALVLIRPDPDDALYLNLAVAAVDHPGEALLARDTLHGFPNIPLSLPVYRVHSFELLSAAIAVLTPLRVLDVAHVLLPFAAGFLLPLAWGRLLRIVAPRRWLAATIALCGVLLLVGDPQQTYGNFSFVRLQQGKAVLLSVVLPLVLAAGLEYGRAPSWRRWLWLAATQVAAVGTSATGLWLAPVTAGLAVLAATSAPLSGRGALTLMRGAGASAYVACMAALLLGETTTLFANAGDRWAASASFDAAREAVLGGGALAFASLFLLLTATTFGTTALARRLALVFAGGFLALFWNPLVDVWVARAITGEPTYWRVFWIAPIPLLAALAISAPLEWFRSGWLRWGGTALLASTFLVAIPQYWTGATANGTRVAAPGWRIPRAAAEAALAVKQHAGAGEFVLAPTAVARWIPTLHDHPTPLVVRELYLNALRGRIPDEEYQQRELLARFVGGMQRPREGASWLAASIESFPLAAVCVAAKSSRWPELTRALEESRLERVWSNAAYEVWARPSGP